MHWTRGLKGVGVWGVCVCGGGGGVGVGGDIEIIKGGKKEGCKSWKAARLQRVWAEEIEEDKDLIIWINMVMYPPAYPYKLSPACAMKIIAVRGTESSIWLPLMDNIVNTVSTRHFLLNDDW